MKPQILYYKLRDNGIINRWWVIGKIVLYGPYKTINNKIDPSLHPLYLFNGKLYIDPQCKIRALDHDNVYLKEEEPPF